MIKFAALPCIPRCGKIFLIRSCVSLINLGGNHLGDVMPYVRVKYAKDRITLVALSNIFLHQSVRYNMFIIVMIET